MEGVTLAADLIFADESFIVRTCWLGTYTSLFLFGNTHCDSVWQSVCIAWLWLCVAASWLPGHRRVVDRSVEANRCHVAPVGGWLLCLRTRFPWMHVNIWRDSTDLQCYWFGSNHFATCAWQIQTRNETVDCDVHLVYIMWRQHWWFLLRNKDKNSFY
jgi:hypothetical protein